MRLETFGMTDNGLGGSGIVGLDVPLALRQRKLHSRSHDPMLFDDQKPARLGRTFQFVARRAEHVGIAFFNWRQ